MSERIYLLPLWLRLWHWINALLILVLTGTGASLHFADPALPVMPFEPAARIHNIAGVALAVTYGFFAVANIASGNWWQYVPKPPAILARCRRQLAFYGLGIFRGEPHPYPPTREAKFNVLQALVYWAVMYLLMPVIVLSGLIFLFPESAPDRVFGLDGLLPVALVHYLAGVAIVLFMIGHIYLGTMGVTALSQFKMMITGWHED